MREGRTTLITGTAVAAVTGWLVWRTAAEQPSATGPRAAPLVEAMRAAGWRAGLAAPGQTTEVEGIRDGVFLYSDGRPGAGQEITLVRDSWPALRWSVLSAWALGCLGGALPTLIAIRRTGPKRPAAVALVLAPATGLAATMLISFLSSTRQSFALDFWGSHALSIIPTLVVAVLVLVLIVSARIMTGLRVRTVPAWLGPDGRDGSRPALDARVDP